MIELMITYLKTNIIIHENTHHKWHPAVLTCFHPPSVAVARLVLGIVSLQNTVPRVRPLNVPDVRHSTSDVIARTHGKWVSCRLQSHHGTAHGSIKGAFNIARRQDAPSLALVKE